MTEIQNAFDGRGTESDPHKKAIKGKGNDKTLADDN